MAKDYPEENPYANIVRNQHRKIKELKTSIKLVCLFFGLAYIITLYHFFK